MIKAAASASSCSSVPDCKVALPVSNLKLRKVAAGLTRANLKPDDLGTVLLAGAFGNFIRRNNARRIGLLPQIPCGRIRFIGNAASLGAKLALLSADERERASQLHEKTEHVDLSMDPEFQNEFGMAMMFPMSDVDTCSDLTDNEK